MYVLVNGAKIFVRNKREAIAVYVWLRTLPSRVYVSKKVKHQTPQYLTQRECAAISCVEYSWLTQDFSLSRGQSSSCLQRMRNVCEVIQLKIECSSGFRHTWTMHKQLKERSTCCTFMSVNGTGWHAYMLHLSDTATSVAARSSFSTHNWVTKSIPIACYTQTILRSRWTYLPRHSNTFSRLVPQGYWETLP